MTPEEHIQMLEHHLSTCLRYILSNGKPVEDKHDRAFVDNITRLTGVEPCK